MKGKKDALQTEPTLQPILRTTMAFPYSCPQCFYPSKAVLSIYLQQPIMFLLDIYAGIMSLPYAPVLL
jgi:hypothetical protein